MAATRSVHAFARRVCRIVDFKTNGNMLKSSPATSRVLSSIRPSGSCATISLSPKTRQLLNSLTKNSKWNKSVFDNISRSSSSSVVCLLTSGSSSITVGLCSPSDELPSEGDEDSTNRKKRIYLVEWLNDDP